MNTRLGDLLCEMLPADILGGVQRHQHESAAIDVAKQGGFLLALDRAQDVGMSLERALRVAARLGPLQGDGVDREQGECIVAVPLRAQAVAPRHVGPDPFVDGRFDQPSVRPVELAELVGQVELATRVAIAGECSGKAPEDLVQVDADWADETDDELRL
jgi:hypothetical protein